MLGYFEMPEDDIPPEQMWHDGKRLEEWMESVKQRREHPDMERIDDAPMEQNEESARIREQLGVRGK